MASRARGEGPKGFSLESSLTRRERHSSAAGVEPGTLVVVPRLRAAVETRSKKRLMLAASCHGRLRPRYGFVAGGSQAIDFLQGEEAESSRRNIQGERAVAHALDFLHMVSDFFKHAPDLPVAAFD